MNSISFIFSIGAFGIIAHNSVYVRWVSIVGQIQGETEKRFSQSKMWKPMTEECFFVFRRPGHTISCFGSGLATLHPGIHHNSHHQVLYISFNPSSLNHLTICTTVLLPIFVYTSKGLKNQSFVDLKDVSLVILSQPNSYHARKSQQLKDNLLHQAKPLALGDVSDLSLVFCSHLNNSLFQYQATISISGNNCLNVSQSKKDQLV
jgi:hypothetical protein